MDTGPSVARISFIEGSVAIQRGDSSQSLAVTLNAPAVGAAILPFSYRLLPTRFALLKSA